MKKAVFLDRDGVVNEVLTDRVKFVNKPKDLYILDGVGRAIQLFNENGYEVFIVTNQGGIGLGYITEKNLHAIHQKLTQEIEKEGGTIKDIVYCPHAPKAGCECRKPKPKMIQDLAKKYDINLSQSYMIGDRDIDITAGKEAGTKTILIGNEKVEHADYYFENLLKAAVWIVTET